MSRAQVRTESGTVHAPPDVFLELGGVGKTNKALETVDVNSVSYQGQRIPQQTTAGRQAGQGGRAKAARGPSLLRLDQQLSKIRCLEHPLPAALLFAESRCYVFIGIVQNFLRTQFPFEIIARQKTKVLCESKILLFYNPRGYSNSSLVLL